MLKGAFGLNRCRRCGVILSWKKVSNLWCSKCIKEVDKELNHIQNKPYDYYFKWYIEHKDGNHNKNLTYYMANNSNSTNDYNSY